MYIKNKNKKLDGGYLGIKLLESLYYKIESIIPKTTLVTDFFFFIDFNENQCMV